MTAKLQDAPAGVKAWLDRTHYSMGLDDLDWVRGWVERAARDLDAALNDPTTHEGPAPHGTLAETSTIAHVESDHVVPPAY